eukprot:scaffold21151_cov42-Prasinocladus_malaysianus.AAC.1
MSPRYLLLELETLLPLFTHAAADIGGPCIRTAGFRFAAQIHASMSSRTSYHVGSRVTFPWRYEYRTP